MPVGAEMQIAPPIERIPEYIDGIDAFLEMILANIVLLGQIPAPTFQEHNRTAVLLDRLADARVCPSAARRGPGGNQLHW